jgi:hypothetical protein
MAGKEWLEEDRRAYEDFKNEVNAVCVVLRSNLPLPAIHAFVQDWERRHEGNKGKEV